MHSVLSGFATVWIVIAVGWACGRVGLLDDRKQLVLNSVAFYIANPCLLFLMMARADLGHAFAGTMLVNVSATLLAGLLFWGIAAWRFRRGAATTVIGTFCACYVNAANLGIPIATYVLGDMSWCAPILLFQTLLLQPAGVTVLDVLEAREQGRRSSVWRNLSLPFRNPLTAGTLAGVVVNALHIPLPDAVAAPVGLIGQMAVPLMLLAFGVSMHANGLPGRGPDTAETWVATVIKLVVHPAIGYGLARLVGLPPATVLAVTVMAGLPSAQNIFVIAQRYGKGVGLARDTLFIDTLLSIPTLLVASLLLH